MSWLDDLLGNIILANGVVLPQRKSINFTNINAVDNPTTGRTDITLSSSPTFASPIVTSLRIGNSDTSLSRFAAGVPIVFSGLGLGYAPVGRVRQITPAGASVSLADTDLGSTVINTLTASGLLTCTLVTTLPVGWWCKFQTNNGGAQLRIQTQSPDQIMIGSGITAAGGNLTYASGSIGPNCTIEKIAANRFSIVSIVGTAPA